MTATFSSMVFHKAIIDPSPSPSHDPVAMRFSQLFLL